MHEWSTQHASKRPLEKSSHRIERMWSSFKKAVVECADRGIGKVKSARCMHGWDREAAAWVANRRFLYQQWTQQRRAAETREQREEALVSLHTYDRYRKELHRKLRQKKAAAEKQQWASLESMQKSDVRGFYRKIKQLRGGKPSTLPERMCRSDGSSTTSDEETRQAWADYFAEMAMTRRTPGRPTAATGNARTANSTHACAHAWPVPTPTVRRPGCHTRASLRATSRTRR
jgi:hypothetical protein